MSTMLAFPNLRICRLKSGPNRDQLALSRITSQSRMPVFPATEYLQRELDTRQDCHEQEQGPHFASLWHTTVS